MQNNQHCLEDIRKAAVLVAALERDEADTLLSHLPDHQAALVRQAILELDDVPPGEQDIVVAEFCHLGGGRWPTPGDDPMRAPHAAHQTAGVPAHTAAPDLREALQFHPPDEAAAALERVSAPADLPQPNQNDPHTPSTPQSDRPFDFLQQADMNWLGRVLKSEHPQTIAVILSHLDGERAARLLFELDSAVQVDVVRRLANLKQMDPHSLRAIEQTLQTLLDKQVRTQHEQATGMQVLEGILAAGDSVGRERLLAQLRRRDARLAEQLARCQPSAVLLPPQRPQPQLAPFAFEELAELDDESLRNVLRAAEPELIMLALTGALQRLVERVLKLFPPCDAVVLQRELDSVGPTRLADVQAAQLRLARLASQLEAQQRGVTRPARLSMAA